MHRSALLVWLLSFWASAAPAQPHQQVLIGLHRGLRLEPFLTFLVLAAILVLAVLVAGYRLARLLKRFGGQGTSSPGKPQP